MMIRHILGNIRRKFNLIRLHRKWSKDFEKLRKGISEKPSIPLDEDARFLILMPHSDDEWIGCSQIITKCKNVLICNMDMQGGDEPDVHTQRYQEALVTANLYNHELYTLRGDKIKNLGQLMLEYNPQYIFLPFYFDWHPEHIEVMNILHEALTRTCYSSKIVMYQVSVPIPAIYSNLFFSMDEKTVKQKWNHFAKTYKTQSFMPVKRFMAHERISGGYSNSYAAEVYSYCESREWQNKLSRMLLNESEIAEAKRNLNSIVLIRDFIERLSKSRNNTI